MSRQIKTDIFGDAQFQSGPTPLAAPADLEPLIDSFVQNPEGGAFYDDLLGRIEKNRYELKEWAQSISLRLDKAAQRFHSIEERMKQATLENHERLASIGGRVKDRNASDLKVEALIERHNQIVQSFELRLSQSQRLIENQALQLSKQQELIDDARRQIEKLKKL